MLFFSVPYFCNFLRCKDNVWLFYQARATLKIMSKVAFFLIFGCCFCIYLYLNCITAIQLICFYIICLYFASTYPLLYLYLSSTEHRPTIYVRIVGSWHRSRGLLENSHIGNNPQGLRYIYSRPWNKWKSMRYLSCKGRYHEICMVLSWDDVNGFAGRTNVEVK